VIVEPGGRPGGPDTLASSGRRTVCASFVGAASLLGPAGAGRPAKCRTDILDRWRLDRSLRAAMSEPGRSVRDGAAAALRVIAEDRARR
jgi:hypothetical protein